MLAVDGAWVSAPGVELVATSCCVCGRALLEAESLASGIGPTCAEKTGYGRATLSPEVRAEVNGLVYRLAILQRSRESVGLLARLRELGFDDLAMRVEGRLEKLVEIRIDVVPGIGVVVAELPQMGDVEFATWVDGVRQVPGRRWRNVTGYRGKVNVVPTTSKAALLAALTRAFPGRVAKGPKGLFVVGGAS